MKNTRLSLLIIMALSIPGFATDVYVAVNGDDNAVGTSVAPFKTLYKAKTTVRGIIPSATGPINVWVRGGVYYLDSALIFTPEDGGTAAAPVTYSAYRGEKVLISGAFKLKTTWASATGPSGTQIMKAVIDTNLKFDQLFLNGKRQIMARYPDYNDTAVLQGNADDALTKATATSNPTEGPGYIRAIHNSLWGGNDYILTKNGSSVSASWVSDNQRGNGMGSRMAENCYEFLTAAGEWYYRKSTGELFFYPPAGTDLNTATIELATLESLFQVTGTATTKVKNITFNRLTFTQTYRTLFSNKYKFEPLLKSDWAVVRMGALFIQDAENVTIKHCFFDQLGGNGIFMNGYNRNHRVYNNEFTDIGATCVQTVGLQSAVRAPSTWANTNTNLSDTTVGPLTPDYPQNIVIENNLMRNFGVFEKQTSAVNISMSSKITVQHNKMTYCPRAAINICDGTWGGHEIAYNDADSCTRETGDHGPFNSWGRDRYWNTDNTTKEMAALDAIDIIRIHNNRFKSVNKDGWPAIDLDDGSSYYWVYNNLCLQNGIKFREGFCRKGYNNIIVVGRQACHAWYGSCYDSIYHNIIVPSYSFTTDGNANAYDIQAMTLSSGNKAYIDYNLFWNNGNGVDYSATKNAGFDQHSQVADPKFTNAAAGDYTVATGSPALAMGFVNFPMDSFGRLSVVPDTNQPELSAITSSRRTLSMSAIRWAHSSKGLIIRCELTEKANVSIEVFSLSGKKVASIVNACETPGAHEYAVNAKTFEPSRLAQTMYLVKVAVGNYCETKNEFIGGQR